MLVNPTPVPRHTCFLAPIDGCTASHVQDNAAGQTRRALLFNSTCACYSAVTVPIFTKKGQQPHHEACSCDDAGRQHWRRRMCTSRSKHSFSRVRVPISLVSSRPSWAILSSTCPGPDLLQRAVQQSVQIPKTCPRPDPRKSKSSDACFPLLRSSQNYPNHEAPHMRYPNKHRIASHRIASHHWTLSLLF